MVDGVNGVSGVNTTRNIDTVKANANDSLKGMTIFIRKNNLTQEQKTAVENLQKQIAAGNVEYHDIGLLETIFSFLIDGKAEDYVTVKGFAPADEELSFGAAKQILKFNLPPGSLRHNKTSRGGGDFDLYQVPKTSVSGQYYLDIYISDLVEGTGLSKDELKVICSQNKE